MADQKPPRAKNLTYAALAGQVGCVSLVLVFAALFLGLWLDSQFGLRGPFTVGLLILSVPISLFVMVRIALGMIAEIQTQSRNKTHKDSSYSEEDDRW